MSVIQIVSHYLAYKFPWWGVCHLKFDLIQKNVFIHCLTPESRAAILRDAEGLAYLDIGVEKFVVVYPGYNDITIPHIPRKTA
jgi:hypothetical protein